MTHVAQLITAIGVSITAIGGFIVSIAVLIPLLRTSKSTHQLVNQQHTDQRNYIRALTRALNAAGIDVPVDQSFPEEGGSGGTSANNS
jgi:hypothetical protein